MQKREFFIKSLMTLGIIVGAVIFVPSFKIQPTAAVENEVQHTYKVPSYTLVQDGTTGKYKITTERQGFTNSVDVFSFGCFAYSDGCFAYGDTVIFYAPDLYKIGEKLEMNATMTKILDDGIVSAYNDDYLTNKATYNKAVDEAGIGAKLE